MEISEMKKGSVIILSLKGRLDASTSKVVEESLLNKINNTQERLFVVDFKQLDYISSAGLRVLLVAAKILKSKNGKIVLANLNDHLKRIFEITGFREIFPIFQNQEEALKNIS
ncbi:MAG: STAS domain-containing protein [Nitrospirales bacterium]